MKNEAKIKAEKYVTGKTFDKSMQGIAQSFARVEESLKMVVQELKNLHEDNKYIKQTLFSFTGDVSAQDRKIQNLTVRIERLESKTK